VRSIKTDGRIELVFAWKLPSTYPTPCCQEIRVSAKIRALPSGILSQTLDLENFATASRSCCQQNSSTVELVDHTYDGCGWTHIVYYTSVDCSPITPILRFVVNLLYNLFLQLCSSWQDFDWHSALQSYLFCDWLIPIRRIPCASNCRIQRTGWVTREDYCFTLSRKTAQILQIMMLRICPFEKEERTKKQKGHPADSNSSSQGCLKQFCIAHSTIKCPISFTETPFRRFALDCNGHVCILRVRGVPIAMMHPNYCLIFFTSLVVRSSSFGRYMWFSTRSRL